MKPEYICFGGAALLCVDPLIQHKKGKLKDVFQQNNENIDNKPEKDNNKKEVNKEFTPEIVDYDLPKNNTGGKMN